jgi:hypothetical protein
MTTLLLHELLQESSSEASSDTDSDAARTLSTVKPKRCRNSFSKRHPSEKTDAPWQRMLDGRAKGANTIDDPNSRCVLCQLF